MTNLEVLPSELTHEVMTMAELHHSRVQIPGDFLFGLGEWIRRPFFVMAGADGAIRLTAIWIGIVTLLAVVIFGLHIPLIGESRGQQTQLFQATAVIITASFVLAHPSRLAFLHVNPSAVREVTARCVALQNASLFDLDACDRILVTAEKICGRRITVLWFFPATGWAVSAYLLQHALASNGADLSAGFIAAFVTLLLAATTAAYSRSVWTVLGLSSAVIDLQRKRLSAHAS